MCEKCEIISKATVREKKQDIVNALDKIKSEYKEAFNKGMNFSMVGSAKRNLVYQRGDSPWDLDFQIYVDRNKLKDVLGGDGEIREWFYDMLKKHLSNTKYSFDNSTSVITINSLEVIGGFASVDIAIVWKDSSSGNNIRVLKMDKESSNNQYIWNELKKSAKIMKKWKLIKGEHWKTLKNYYKDKKCKNSLKEKDDQKTSTEILMDAINRTAQKHNL